jgi:ATP phosphoribosyltransferase regulatory subunit
VTAPEVTDAAALPAGARDVLPVEASELAAIEAALRGAFARFGYREVMTPVIELARTVDRAQDGGLRAFRLFDDHGRVLVLRPDLTIPVSRLVASRLADHPGPVRVSYVGPAFRPPAAGRPESAEQRQAGVELVGLADPAADAEVLALLVEGLRESGVDDARVAVGDVSLTSTVLDALGLAEELRAHLRAAAAARTFVAWRRVAQTAGLAPDAAALLAELPTLRGGPEVLERVRRAVPAAGPACERLLETRALLEEHGVADAILLDLGVLRDWPYYSGIVFEAYAAGVGTPVAMGGRYDGLGERFGRSRPAVGFAVALDLLHRAVALRGNGASGVRAGVVLVGGLDQEVAAARAVRRAGLPVVALPAGDATAESLAAADGWRFVARREGDGFAVTDLVAGTSFGCARLEEDVPCRV